MSKNEFAKELRVAEEYFKKNPKLVMGNDAVIMMAGSAAEMIELMEGQVNSYRVENELLRNKFKMLVPKECLQFPEHKCGMYIHHNAHKDYYETVEKAIGDDHSTYPRDCFENEEAIAECIKTGDVWEVHWYPETPIGFIHVFAPTLEDALRLACESDEDETDE